MMHQDEGTNGSKHRCSVHQEGQLAEMRKVRKSSLQEAAWALKPLNEVGLVLK